jgi:hypothetical protein
MLPSVFLKVVGVCLIGFGLYDTRVYLYAIGKGQGSFDFFGRVMPASHRAIRIGFSAVIAFYYLVGAALIAFG